MLPQKRSTARGVGKSPSSIRRSRQVLISIISHAGVAVNGTPVSPARAEPHRRLVPHAHLCYFMTYHLNRRGDSSVLPQRLHLDYTVGQTIASPVSGAVSLSRSGCTAFTCLPLVVLLRSSKSIRDRFSSISYLIAGQLSE